MGRNVLAIVNQPQRGAAKTGVCYAPLGLNLSGVTLPTDTSPRWGFSTALKPAFKIWCEP